RGKTRRERQLAQRYSHGVFRIAPSPLRSGVPASLLPASPLRAAATHSEHAVSMLKSEPPPCLTRRLSWDSKSDKVMSSRKVFPDFRQACSGTIRNSPSICLRAATTSPPATSPATVISSPKNLFFNAIVLSLVFNCELTCSMNSDKIGKNNSPVATVP